MLNFSVFFSLDKKMVFQVNFAVSFKVQGIHLKKHRKNRKTLPGENHISCQMCQIALSKNTE